MPEGGADSTGDADRSGGGRGRENDAGGPGAGPPATDGGAVRGPGPGPAAGGTATGGVRTRAREAVDLLTGAPGLGWAGLGVVATTLLVAVAAVPLWAAAETLALAVLQVAGLATETRFGGVRAARSLVIVVRTGLFVVLLLALGVPAVALARAGAATLVARTAHPPADGGRSGAAAREVAEADAGGRADSGADAGERTGTDSDGWGRRVADALALLPSVLIGAAVERSATVLFAAAFFPTLVGAYFVAGTALRAAGYALGVLDPLAPPSLFPWVVVGVAAGLAWVAARGVTGYAVPLATRVRSVTALRATLAYADRHRRRGAAHGAVLLGATLLPAALAAGVGVALGAVAGAPAGTVGGLATYLLAGTPAAAFATAYRVRVATAEVGPYLPGSRDGEGGRGDGRPSGAGTADGAGSVGRLLGAPARALAWLRGPRGRRLALVAVLVAASVVGGGALRVADVRPGVGAAPPGPVDADDDPRSVLRAGYAHLERASYESVGRSFGRNLSNRSDAETEFSRVRFRHDREDRELLGVVAVGYDGGSLYELNGVYATPTAVGLSFAETSRPTADRSVLDDRGWGVLPVPVQRRSRFAGSPGPERLGRNWTVARAGEDRVVYRSEAPATVVAFLGDPEEPDRLIDGAVTVRVDARTGRIERVRARARYRSAVDGRNATLLSRRVVTYSGYGDTDVRRPAGTVLAPVEVLFDAVLY